MANLFNKVTSLNKNPESGDDGYLMYSKQFNDLVDALNALIPEGVLEIDVINEDTGDAGVTIDGVNLKDYKLQTFRRSILSSTTLQDSDAFSLTTSQSGNIILLDKADGVTITLPTDALGLTYRFLSTVDLTSNDYIIQGASSEDLFIGGVSFIDDTTPESATMFKPDVVDDYIMTMNGTTTGGEIGTDITITCVGNNRWWVSGTVAANGVIATPFS